MNVECLRAAQCPPGKHEIRAEVPPYHGQPPAPGTDVAAIAGGKGISEALSTVPGSVATCTGMDRQHLRFSTADSRPSRRAQDTVTPGVHGAGVFFPSIVEYLDMCIVTAIVGFEMLVVNSMRLNLIMTTTTILAMAVILCYTAVTFFEIVKYPVSIPGSQAPLDSTPNARNENGAQGF